MRNGSCPMIDNLSCNVHRFAACVSGISQISRWWWPHRQSLRCVPYYFRLHIKWLALCEQLHRRLSFGTHTLRFHQRGVHHCTEHHNENQHNLSPKVKSSYITWALIFTCLLLKQTKLAQKVLDTPF